MYIHDYTCIYFIGNSEFSRRQGKDSQFHDGTATNCPSDLTMAHSGSRPTSGVEATADSMRIPGDNL